MSRNQGMRWLAVLSLLGAFCAQAMAASVAVTVSGGTVVLDPAEPTLAATDDTLQFQLATPGYVFPASGAVVVLISGSSASSMACTTQAGGLKVNCRRSVTSSTSQRTLRVKVQPAGGSGAKAPPTLDGIIYVYDN